MPNHSRSEHMVDIIVPVFNQEAVVAETVNSVLQQTFLKWNLIIINDGSTDRTPEILSQFAELDKRIEIVNGFHISKGACQARNLGFCSGKAPYVLFLDSDDVLEESCLEHRVSSLRMNEGLDFVIGNTLLFDTQPNDLDILWNEATCDARADLLRFLRQDMPWHTMGPLWRRASFTRLGGWNECLDAFQDWELHVRACYLNMQYAMANTEPDAFYRRPRNDRASIASSHMTAEKILARQLAVRSVASLSDFMESPDRRDHLEAFCLRNALQLLDSNRRGEGFDFLWDCIKHGLFRPSHAFGAIGILSRGKHWRGSRFARCLRSSLWSSDSRVDPWEEVQRAV